MGKSKFYAVRRGKAPGIYTDWPSCEAVTKNFPKAEFKSFNTKQEAEAYLGSAAATTAAPPPQLQHAQAAGTRARVSAAGGKWYGILRGHQTGVFSGTWSDVKHMVEGFSGALYKGFPTRAEAEQWLHDATGHNQPAAAAAGAGGAGGGGASTLSGSKRSYSSMEGSQPPSAFTAGGQPAAAAAAAAGGGMGASQQQPQQQRELMVNIFFDGGSRGNPGRAGYGYAIFERSTNQQLRLGCKPLPHGSTNNEAEYTGMIAGLKYAVEVLGARHVVVKGDSQLVVRQMLGEYKVNARTILPLYREAKQLEERYTSFEIKHVYREENGLADTLSNMAMDTDLVVDQIVAGQAGSTRRQMALALARACQLDQHYEQWQQLCTAPSFLEAAAGLLSYIWDATPVEEIIAELNARGWDTRTGGPAEPPAPAGTAAGGGGGAAAAAAAAGGGGGSSMPTAAGAGAVGGGVSGRGQQTVAVAAVSLGPQWAAEISKQEALMQQQQRQQRPQRQQQQQKHTVYAAAAAPVTGQLGFEVHRTGGGGSGGGLPAQRHQVLRSRYMGGACGSLHEAAHSSNSSSSSNAAGSRGRQYIRAAPATSSCSTLLDHVGRVQPQPDIPQLQCRQQSVALQAAASTSNLAGVRLQRGLQGPGFGGRPFRPQGSSSSSSSMGSVSGGRGCLQAAQLQRCRCSCSVSGRTSCALHAAVLSCRAVGGARVCAAAAAAGLAAVAVAGRLRHNHQHREHFSSRGSHSLRRM